MMNERKIRLFGGTLVLALWLVLTALIWFGPRQDISEAERRKLEQLPPVTAQSVLGGSFMTKFETFTQDQFPLRDTFRTVKALFNQRVLLQGDNNGIYLADGYAAKMEYPLSVSSAEGAVKKFGKIYDQYLSAGDHRIVFAVVPDKGYYLAPGSGHLSLDVPKLMGIMSGLDWAQQVDITPLLDAQDYYRTDTHWRQERIWGVADRLASALDADIAPEESYTVTALERPFYGVYYGQAALPMEPETMYLMESEVLSGCTVTDLEGRTSSVYDMEKLTSRDLYDVYLSGSAGLLTIENPSGPSDRELIVFRDSFGSSLIPLLVSGYGRVIVVDTRYLPTAMLGNFITFDRQDILLLYSTLVLNSSAMLK